MKLGYVIVYVADVAATVKFYEAAFNLECRFAHESGMYSEMETGGTVLAFANEDFTPSKGAFTPNRAGQKSSGAEIAFLTSDVEKQFKHALASGAVALMQPTMKPWGQTVAYVKDLNGFLVELCTPMG